MRDYLFFYLIVLLLYTTCSCDNNVPPKPPQYVPSSACFECHEEEYKLWEGSHHDLAMDTATSDYVLGDFDSTAFIHLGDSAFFYNKNGSYYVYTLNENKEYKHYRISYVFGHYPLQQYLIKFPGGKLQVLPYAWDSRSADENGQKWFHIYGDEKIAPHDELFWTKQYQNWNHVCAECHSTNLAKNFDTSSLSYHTTWSEIDVGCDACHGPSSHHMEWAKLEEQGKDVSHFSNMGYDVSFTDDSLNWVFDLEKGTAFLESPRTNHKEVEMCARCHSIRLQIWKDYVHGEELMQTHVPELLYPWLYHFDGQIKEEVYVYGSFLQSKMYHKGVTCSDCHDPHSGDRVAPGKLVCAKCHMFSKYNDYSHHFHKPDSTGGDCIECHMPQTAYMVNDLRADHSIRIPRPDLTVKLGTPNACNQCHTDKSAKWANNWFKKWYGDKFDTTTHFGELFHAAYQHDTGARSGLISLVQQKDINAIIRASAIHYLEYVADERTISHIKKFISDDEPMVRMAAIKTLSNLSAPEVQHIAQRLSKDPVRAVRHESILAHSKASGTNTISPALGKIQLLEYVKMLNTNADQAPAHANMGLLYASTGKIDSALLAYNMALAIDSNSVAALINKADIFRQKGYNKKSLELLEKATASNQGSPELFIALGMAYTRSGEQKPALEAYKKAYNLEPENSYYTYIYAIALHSYGFEKKSVNIVKKGLSHTPENPNLIHLLNTYTSNEQ